MLVLLVICMSGSESPEKRKVFQAGPLEQENAAILINCFRKGALMCLSFIASRPYMLLNLNYGKGRSAYLLKYPKH